MNRIAFNGILQAIKSRRQKPREPVTDGIFVKNLGLPRRIPCGSFRTSAGKKRRNIKTDRNLMRVIVFRHGFPFEVFRLRRVAENGVHGKSARLQPKCVGQNRPQARDERVRHFVPPTPPFVKRPSRPLRLAVWVRSGRLEPDRTQVWGPRASWPRAYSPSQ